jgi:hypothetical protein
MSVSRNTTGVDVYNTFVITDDRGHICCSLIDAEEPPAASIVMTNGNYGNAWQRHGNDGLWHSTTGGKRRWAQLLRMRNLVLVYEAPEREPTPRPFQQALTDRLPR